MINKKKEKIDLLVFVDESYFNSSITLIGILVVELSLFNKIIKIIEKEFYDTKDLPEIHFNEHQHADYIKRGLADKYIELISNKGNKGLVYINVAIVDRNKLDIDTKRPNDKQKKIERIFTRIAITYAINKFSYKYKEVKIKDIFIDKGGKTDDSLFRNYAINKIRSKSRAKLPENVKYINSNPRKEKENSKFSVFIDIIDIILGAFNNCCSIEKRATNKFKKRLSEKIFNSILEIIIQKRNWLGKLNTHPKRRKIDKYGEKDLSGKNNKIIKIKYFDDPYLLKKFTPKPYNQLK